MESCYWCSDCSEMFEAGSHHLEHSFREVGGSDVIDTISALDEMINFGLARLETHEQEVSHRIVILDIFSFKFFPEQFITFFSLTWYVYL